MRLSANKQTYDLILSIKWCYDHRAILDFYTNTVTFQHKETRFFVKATHAKDPGLISVNALTKDALQGHALFSVALKTSTSDKRDAKSLPKDLQELIFEFKDVLPGRLLWDFRQNEPWISTLN